MKKIQKVLFIRKKNKGVIWAYVFTLFFARNVFACDCNQRSLAEMQKVERENSECIFVGEIFEVDPNLAYYKIRVVESLDGGDLQGNIYIGKNLKYCQPYVDKKGYWLVYGAMVDGFLEMNTCGLSRTFDEPQAPPSRFDYNIFGVDEDTIGVDFYENFHIEFWKKQRLDLANEISALREKRDKKIIKQSR
ncbi:hypothetical protein [Maribacter sp. 4G9]|uniref:hypothetical protein n=1 Tax=Maribacter sp. 4G9 TaxID=1889777 RepID=UPI000C155B02|nr:hypothetical protein [Maribacter sp. 4G9]PIB30617.1 hypothetical protein BFP75_02475 [Maribacter sp. 4G9]